MTRRLGLAGLAFIAALAIVTPSASATSSRAEYAAQVNPICASANAQADQVYAQLTAKLKRLARKRKKAGQGGNSGNSIITFKAEAKQSKKERKRRNGSLDLFDRLFYEAYERVEMIYTAAFAQIALIPSAPGDESLVSRWLANDYLIQALTEQATELSKRIDRLFNREFTGKKIGSFRNYEQKLRRLERKSNRINRQLEIAYDLDVELGTQLGVTYCVTGATGVSGSI